jgi:hypothetical protein
MKRYSLIRGEEEDAAAAAAAAAAAKAAAQKVETQDFGLGCADVCGLAREPEEVAAMGDDAAVTLLVLNQTGLVIVIGIQMALASVWIMLGLVPGFTLYDGAAGVVSAYTHAGWWELIDGATIVFGLCSIWFGINYVPSQRLVERGIARNLTWLLFYMILLGVNTLSHILHLSFSANEAAHCDSTLCVNNGTVLYVFIAGLAMEALLNIWAIVEAHKYRTNLGLVVAMFEYVLVVKEPGKAQTAAPADVKQRLVNAKSPSIRMPIQHKMK